LRRLSDGEVSSASFNRCPIKLRGQPSGLILRTRIKPIFQSRCQPCHFQGGQVYDKMPFDKPETITRLGTKLFTRIKEEKERTMIREFLDSTDVR
jgi:hypothetical protein